MMPRSSMLTGSTVGVAARSDLAWCRPRTASGYARSTWCLPPEVARLSRNYLLVPLDVTGGTPARPGTQLSRTMLRISRKRIAMSRPGRQDCRKPLLVLMTKMAESAITTVTVTMEANLTAKGT